MAFSSRLALVVTFTLVLVSNKLHALAPVTDQARAKAARAALIAKGVIDSETEISLSENAVTRSLNGFFWTMGGEFVNESKTMRLVSFSKSGAAGVVSCYLGFYERNGLSAGQVDPNEKVRSAVIGACMNQRGEKTARFKTTDWRDWHQQ
jgi:hypothetical protein